MEAYDLVVIGTGTARKRLPGKFDRQVVLLRSSTTFLSAELVRCAVAILKKPYGAVRRPSIGRGGCSNIES